MPAIKLEQFGGMLPAWNAQLLPTGQASYSENGYLFSGVLTGWRKPSILRTLTNSAARSVYRIPTVSQVQAKAYLVFIENPHNGDVVTVGEINYTFVTALANAQDVLIGADATATATNFINAVTADKGLNTNAGVTYGTDTVLNAEIYYTLPDTDARTGLSDPTVTSQTISGTPYAVATLGALEFGAAFNNVSLASTHPNREIWVQSLAALAPATTHFLGGTNPSFDAGILSSSIWLEFNDQDTDVVKSPVVDDQWNRYYWASPSDMPKYNTYDRIAAGDDPWLLGVPPPGCAVTLAVTGGGNNLQLGNPTQSGGSINLNNNYVYLLPVVPTGDTAIQDVSFNLSSAGTPDYNTDSPTNWAAVIYEDNNGLPGNLLNTGAIVKGVKNDEVNQSAFTNPTQLLGNSQYWIGIILDKTNAFEGGPAGGGSNMAFFEAVFTNGPPATAPNELPYTTVTSDGTNVANGDRITIGFNTYTFQTVLTNVPGNVLIGGTATQSLQNLADCINYNAGTAGTAFAASSAANSLVSAGTAAANALLLQGLTHNVAGSNITSTFTPVGTPPHLSFPKATFNEGMVLNQNSINMWGDFITSDVIEARAYVYTWVSAYGEEGPPSPPTILNGWSNGTWELGLWQPPPDDLGVLRNLKKIKIYRTVPAQGGSTVFFYVDTVDIGTATYTDTIPDSTVALNDQLPSNNWFPPPENLEGFTVMQNGVIAGFTGNQIWFCEPYRPHAWPPGYSLTTDYTIVGLGVTNGVLVACTAAQPYVIQGQAPGQMSMLKCAVTNPCLSRGSILSHDQAVTYMSPNGLIQVNGNGQAINTTDLWITREKWQQLTPQKYVHAVFVASCYYALGTPSPDGSDVSVAQRGFTIELDADNASFTIWPQPGGHRLGFNVLTSPTGSNIETIMTDPWSGTAMMIADGKVYYLDFSNPLPEYQQTVWRSKVYQQNVKRSYSAMKVFFNVPSYLTQNETVIEEVASDPVWDTLDDDRYGFIKTYVDVDGTGELTLIDCREIRASGGLLRIVDGFKADQWMWEIVSNVIISNVQIGTSAKDLGSA